MPCDVFAEATLIPDLVKTDEDQEAAEDLRRIQPQYNPPQQHTESVFEPRSAIEYGQQDIGIC